RRARGRGPRRCGKARRRQPRQQGRGSRTGRHRDGPTAGATAMSGNHRPRRKDGIDPVARSRARRRALQAIYAWQVSGGNARRVFATFAHEQAHEVADLEYFEDLVRGVLKHVAELDAKLAAFVDREVGQVDHIERAALRIAAYELLHRVDVPYKVVINEAIDTTKRFGSEHGHTYVNGVLDHAAAEWRAAEWNSR